MGYLLVISAANLNTYCVAVHCEMLRALGVPLETSGQVAVDHSEAGLPEADVALLDFGLGLAKRPGTFAAADIEWGWRPCPIFHLGASFRPSR